MAGPGSRLRSESFKCPETVPRNKEKEMGPDEGALPASCNVYPKGRIKGHQARVSPRLHLGRGETGRCQETISSGFIFNQFIKANSETAHLLVVCVCASGSC